MSSKTRFAALDAGFDDTAEDAGLDPADEAGFGDAEDAGFTGAEETDWGRVEEGGFTGAEDAGFDAADEEDEEAAEGLEDDADGEAWEDRAEETCDASGAETTRLGKGSEFTLWATLEVPDSADNEEEAGSYWQALIIIARIRPPAIPNAALGTRL